MSSHCLCNAAFSAHTQKHLIRKYYLISLILSGGSSSETHSQTSVGCNITADVASAEGSVGEGAREPAGAQLTDADIVRWD